MPFMETVFQALARHSSSLPVYLIRGSVGGEFFFLFFLPFDVGMGSGASSSSSRSAYCSSSSSSTSWVPSPNLSF
jgi:hypothetical protein